ncbi:MAG: PTS system trehalose-specific EIIBC component [Lachnospiraceae bacterium]|nr:PTS system trehalose-specific EIIBC component [Lachnospiraceae bacterium]MBR7016119.1 PTS system trehalose-specific EIIBC component [Lachnospiraceae bacterium]
MGKYSEDAKELLQYVGGKENVGAVAHCMTRMRFMLNDPKKADIGKIEGMKVVKGTFTQSGQFQVIIGNTVSEFYNDFVEVSGISGVSKDAVKQAAKKNQNPLQRLATVLAEIFTPLLPAIITGGLILGFRNVIDSLYIFEGGHTLVELSQFWAGVDHFLWLIGEAVFHVGIPVGICWSVARKMGTTEMLGLILGLTLVSGQLLNAYGVAGTAAADIPKWNFGFIQVNMIGYQAQVIPAMLAAFCLVYLEKFFRKIIPAVVSMIFVPFFSLTLSVMAAHFVLGPIGWKIGSVISSVVYAGITGPVKILFAAIFGFVYAPLVITGLHHMTNAIDLQLVADFGGTMLWPMIALSNIAQGSAVLAMIVLQRKNAEKQEINIPSCISCYLGVTEPAIFGINLKYMFPFICAMTGSAIAAIFSVATGCMAASIGVGGLPGILSMIPQYWGFYAIAMLIAIAVPFALTFIIGKNRGVDKEEEIEAEAAAEAVAKEEAKAEANRKPAEFTAFLTGKTVAIENVPDQAFASKALGDGVAIDPTDNVLRAPADAKVSLTMPESNHAVGLLLNNGVEVLLHIGLDTIAMNGDGFKCFVKEGQAVKKGQALIEFDVKKIKAAGHPLITMMVITDDNGFENLTFKAGADVKAGATAIGSIS